MKKILTLLVCVVAIGFGTQAKKVLDHTSFDDWKSLQIRALSNSGDWAAYEINPQEGDGKLFIRNTKTGKEIVINRGYQPSFTADSKYAVAKIKPFFQATRQAKIAKKTGLQLPQDSLAIINLASGAIEKIPGAQSYALGKNGGDWVAYTTVDTAYISPKALKNKEIGYPLVIQNLANGSKKVVNWVKSFKVSEDGLKVSAILQPAKKDTTATAGLGVVILPDTAFYLIDRDKKFYGNMAFNKQSSQLAYFASNDSNTSGSKQTHLMLADLKTPMSNPRELKVTDLKLGAGATGSEGLIFNQYSTPRFSADGKMLMSGIAAPVAPNDTTIVPFETATLDIWRWDSPLTPPEEKSNLRMLTSRTLPVVFNLDNNAGYLLTSNPLVSVSPNRDMSGNIAVYSDPTKWAVNSQWDTNPPREVSVINLTNGQLQTIGELKGRPRLSPAGKYVSWFADGNYYVFNPATGTTTNISEAVDVPLYNEDDDRPQQSPAYGMAGWTKDDKALLVYDRYDIWSLDPTGKTAPVNITAGNGRNSNLRYRYVATDANAQSITPGQEMLLSVFNYIDKQNGLATLKLGKPAAPALKTIEPYQFTQIAKAKNAPVYAFQKANFNTSPDAYIINGTDFAKAQKVSDVNPQMKDYNWGTAELVSWNSYSGKPTQGVLYKPEDFDPNKKYPLLVVFYETNSENLYKYYNMEPSWSWVNYPFYVSRGYVILVPDVHYTAGFPGESAYDYICSGVDELCKKSPWIDKDRIGIDGQSWGGYQTAFLVTRTNMFACAGSGAPVSNMTSAYGGIRWESGNSRQHQYELGQSRIGRTLWDAPELYIANSPIFHANKVETPLLIIANDADGAVPWYQGIEMFMGLRRLQKPVWMLTYNNEAHNLRERRNRKDITIRLQQFFDHYLKGDPMPVWMKDGVPMTRKGQEFGTALTSE